MVYTSYFGNLKNIPSDVICYSIAGKTPDWYVKLESQRIRTFPILAPKKSWWREWHKKFESDLESEESKSRYEERYSETVLANLNADAIIRMLTDHNPTQDICLLCYETPEKFCHRHIVAKWLNRNGIKCEEFTQA